MKAISLWQPWASLVATGAKQWETRSWATSYRGPLAIHAAKAGISKSELRSQLARVDIQGGLAPLVNDPLEIRAVMHWVGVTIADLPFGAIIAVVQLIDCKLTDSLTIDEIGLDWPFGDFSAGRYAWRLEQVRRITPIPYRGAMGFFNWRTLQAKKHPESWDDRLNRWMLDGQPTMWCPGKAKP